MQHVGTANIRWLLDSQLKITVCTTPKPMNARHNSPGLCKDMGQHLRLREYMVNLRLQSLARLKVPVQTRCYSPGLGKNQRHFL